MEGGARNSSSPFGFSKCRKHEREANSWFNDWRGDAFTAVLSFADTPGRHPAYLHSRTDLRRAARLMEVNEEPNVRRDLAAASHEAHEAIREIDAAARWDRKDIQDNPPVDTYPNRAGRFRAIAQFLFAGDVILNVKRTIQQLAPGAIERCITSMSRSDWYGAQRAMTGETIG